jgi:hypothetical protein
MILADYLKKKPFSRREFSASQYRPQKGTPRMAQMRKPGAQVMFFSQEQYMNELHSGSHVIYDCIYRSMRPKYKWNAEKQVNELDGYDDVTRMSVSWQEAIRSNKAATCGGNAPWIGNEGDEENAKYVATIKSYCNRINLQAALMSLFTSAFGTADGALYFYRDGDDIAWQCFSYEYGSNCTMSKDYENPDEEMGVRYFDLEGRDAVELYRNKYIELYVKFKDVEEMLSVYPDAYSQEESLDPEKPEDMATVKRHIETEDHYFLVIRKAHGLEESPFCYFREPDTPYGPVQNNIEDWEKLLSDCGENIKYYAYQMLFIRGGAMNLPNANFGGKVLGSKSPDGDAKILEPADASNTLTIGFKETRNAICDGSKSVFIKPEDLKGQNDSGAYIANLYWPEIQWAKLFYARFHHCMVKILRVIKQLVGLIEGDSTGFRTAKVSYMFTPFLPKNSLEETQILQYSVEAGFMSQETAAEESDYTNPNEKERLAKEKAEKQKMELEAARAVATPEPTPAPTK